MRDVRSLGTNPEVFVREAFPSLADARPEGPPRRMPNSVVWRWRMKDRGHVWVKWRPQQAAGPLGMERMHRVLRHLRTSGIPFPETLASLSGSPWILNDGQWVETWRAGLGRDAYVDRPPFAPLLDAAHARAIGRLLGRLAAVRPVEPAHRPVGEAGVWADVSWIGTGAAPTWPMPTARAMLHRWWREVRPFVEALLARHSASSAGGLYWHHGDPLPRNMLFSKDEISSVLDPEAWTTGPEGLDLALAVAALALPWPVLAAGGQARPRVAADLLAGFADVRRPPPWEDLLPLVVLGRVGSAGRRASRLAAAGRFGEAHDFLKGQLTMLRWWQSPAGRLWHEGPPR